jgi:putative transposase
MSNRRKFSKEEKLRIVREAAANGVKATLEKHGVYPATFYAWKKKVEQMGEAGLRRGMMPAHLREIRRLEKENERLKQLVAEERLQGKLKDELLRKKYPWARGRN